jgi:hypothetical protein
MPPKHQRTCLQLRRKEGKYFEMNKEQAVRHLRTRLDFLNIPPNQVQNQKRIRGIRKIIAFLEHPKSCTGPKHISSANEIKQITCSCASCLFLTRKFFDRYHGGLKYTCSRLLIPIDDPDRVCGTCMEIYIVRQFVLKSAAHRLVSKKRKKIKKIKLYKSNGTKKQKGRRRVQ